MANVQVIGLLSSQNPRAFLKPELRVGSIRDLSFMWRTVPFRREDEPEMQKKETGCSPSIWLWRAESTKFSKVDVNAHSPTLVASQGFEPCFRALIGKAVSNDWIN